MTDTIYQKCNKPCLQQDEIYDYTKCPFYKHLDKPGFKLDNAPSKCLVDHCRLNLSSPCNIGCGDKTCNDWCSARQFYTVKLQVVDIVYKIAELFNGKKFEKVAKYALKQEGIIKQLRRLNSR